MKANQRLNLSFSLDWLIVLKALSKICLADLAPSF
jgi:hypothetical protein